MNAAHSGMMHTLFFSMGQGKNHVTYSSVSAIRKNLKKYHDKDIKRRWAFQVKKDLKDDGYIKWKELYKNDDNGLITQIPSVIWFTLKGVVWLVKKGQKGAKELYKSMVKWLNKDDNRAPARKDFDDGSYKPATPEEKKRLNDLLTSSTRDMNKIWD